MKIKIERDLFDNPRPPRIFLCNTGKTILGELHTYDESLAGKWNSYSELTFSIDRQYSDALTGELIVDPLFDKVEGLRNVYVENIGYFTIQDPNTSYGDKDSKTVTCFSTEYTTSVKYLENFYVNNGETDSIEVTYEQSKYGDSATIDDMYKLASYDNYDSTEEYYHRVYKNTSSYTYEQIQINDETAYETHFGEDISVDNILYVHGYANVQFYDKYTPELSLLHNIFNKIPEWSIGNVDYALWHKERKLEEERVSVYDFLMNTVSDVFDCVVEWDTINNKVNFYEEAEDGITEDDTVQERFETDVYISRDNLAREVNVQYSTDDIKTKLKVSGADGIDIREVNLGKNYIMNLDYYHNEDWMEQDLFEAYDDYLTTVEDNKQPYEEAMQGWVTAYNNWDELMNAVPAENDVLLVGDEFKKLYCIYEPIDNAYLPITLTVSNIGTLFNTIYSDSACTQAVSLIGLEDATLFSIQGYAFIYQSDTQKFKCDRSFTPENVVALIKKLNLYHVDDDLEGNQSDNILLRLKNTSSDTASIRIYDPKRQVEDSESYDPNAQYYVRSTTLAGKYQYSKISFSDETDYNNNTATLYTNNYKIQTLIVRASSGISEAAKEYTLSQWVGGLLIVGNSSSSPLNNLSGFKISAIGTMGAYLCLAKNEVQDVVEMNIVTHKPTDYLKSFGVSLLESKLKTYTTLFQTQIEKMFSQEKYQCVVSDFQPDGVYDNGTRWFDSANNQLKVYQIDSGATVGSWVIDDYAVSSDDAKNYENYQRYIDNFYKMRAVQEVLNEKEKEAQYWLNGYAVSDRQIDYDAYTPDEDDVLRLNGQSLEADMQRAAEKHFDGWTVTRKDMDQTIPLYTFTTSAYPDKEFVVYLNGKTPYVSYSASRSRCQTLMNKINELTNLENFFNDDQWLRLSPFIREDEYSNDNILLTGYESEEERVKIYNQLLSEATKELKKIAQPSLEFSMEMDNILALPEFEPILNQFELGNFVRVELRPGLVKRARLLEFTLNFSNLSEFSCQFGNLVTQLSEIDKHAELLSQAVQAGKQVAASAGEWQKAVDKSNKLEQDIANGLQDMSLKIGKASGQAISWDSTGMHFRKYKDGSDSEYEPEEMAIINNALVATNDSWKTSKAAFGQYTINGETRWGPIAEYVTADTIEGKFIKGGSLRIGGNDTYFQVNEDGSVAIMSGGQAAYAGADVVAEIENARQYRVELTYSNSTVFNQPNQSCLITAKVYKWDVDITSRLPVGTTYSWVRNSSSDDTLWNTSHANQLNNTITITNEDVNNSAQFSCICNFDDTNL